MKSQSINSLVDCVLLEIEKFGLKDSTKEIYGRYLKRLLLFFEDNNKLYYSKQLIEEFLNQKMNDFKSKKITLRYYNALKRGAYLVEEYAETGSIKWKVFSDTRKFRPNIYYTRYIEDALSRSDLKTEFQYKINCVLRKFCCFLEEKGIDSFEQLSSQTVKDFILSVRETNSGSMYYILYSLKLLIEYLNNNDLISNSINLDYYHIKSKKQILVSGYSHEEIERIIHAIDRSTAIGKRDYAIIMLVLNTGLRGIDVRKLKLQDIDWHENSINIFQSKTSKPLKLPLKGCVCNAIADYILNARPKTTEQNVFVRNIAPFEGFINTAALDGIIERYCLSAGIPKKHLRSFHSLRRSIGTWLAEKEVAIHTISQILGHTDMNSSKPYLSFNQKQMSACAMSFEDIPMSGGMFV
jgi:integrase